MKHRVIQEEEEFNAKESQRYNISSRLGKDNIQ